MQLTEKQIEDHKAWLQDQKPAYQAYVGVLIADKLTAAESALAEVKERIDKMHEKVGDLLMRNMHIQSQLAAAQRDAELLNWLEENHFFSGTEGDENRSLVWKFHTPNNGRQWQPLREKLSAEIAISATSAGEKGDDQ